MIQKLPQHAGFRVARASSTREGMPSPAISEKYGPSLLLFRDAITLFAHPRLYEAHKDRLDNARPAITAMKAIVFNGMPLAELPYGELKVLIDGRTYVKTEEKMVGGSIITELIQVDEKHLAPETAGKPNQVLKAERGIITVEKPGKVFITYMLEGNDQVSIDAPKAGWNRLDGMLPFLFNEQELADGKSVQKFLNECGNLQVSISYQDKQVSGGSVSTGLKTFLGNDYRMHINIPHRICYGNSGALVYSTADSLLFRLGSMARGGAQKQQPAMAEAY